MEDIMRPKNTLLLVVILALILMMGFHFRRNSSNLTLLSQNSIELSPITRLNAKSIFTSKLDDYGQPISLGTPEKDENVPTLSNAISQQIILDNQLQTLKTDVQAAQDLLDVLKQQQKVLIEEATPFETLLTKKYLNPINKMKRQLNSKTDAKSLELLSTLDQSFNIITTFVNNPNLEDTGSQLTQTIDEVNSHLSEHEMNNLFSVISIFFQSGPHQTSITFKYNELKDLLSDFKKRIENPNSEALSHYKKSKRQQQATEDAIELKSSQLDDLLLNLTRLLDEIEQVTQ